MRFAANKSTLLTAAAVFTMAAALTLFLFESAHRLEEKNRVLDFTNHALPRIDEAEVGINQALTQLLSVNRFLTAAGVVSESQFATFTRPLLLDNPQILAISYQRMITDQHRDQFEAELRQRGKSSGIFQWQNGAKIAPAKKTSYRVVDLIEPDNKDASSVGLDASSMATQQDAVARTRLTGLPAATAIFSLGRDKTAAVALPKDASARFVSQRGFLILMPVFEQDAQPVAGQPPQAEPLGYSAALFRTGEMIERIFRTHGLLDNTDLAVEIFGKLENGKEEVVFQTGMAFSDSDGRATFGHWLLGSKALRLEKSFHVAGKPWRVLVRGAPTSASAKIAQSQIILLAGGVVSLLLAMFAYVLASRSSQIRRLVASRTGELAVANARLIADLDERQQILDELNVRTRAIEASANAIIITSAAGSSCIVEYVNPAFERNTGYSSAEAVGRSCNFLQREDRDQPGIDEIRAALREQRACHVVLRNYRKDGSLFWNDLHISPVADGAGVVRHFVAAQYDISAMKTYEAELQAHVNTDTLTGLPNRNLLRDRLSQANNLAGRYEHRVWLVFLDLDRFRLVNDSLGHKAGNAILVQLAARLAAALRETDTVARLSGDKFVLVLDERDALHSPLVAIQRIRAAIRPGFVVESQEVFLTASMGISIYPQDTVDQDLLIEHAEKAMYRAKEKGGDGFQFYGPQLTAQALDRLEIESDLRKAIEQNEFVLFYQPQVDVVTGQVCGVEALIRWMHPHKGMIAPDRFIGIAEECGLILPIGEWVLRTACRQATLWHAQGFPDLCIAVNLSARQFMQENLATVVAGILAETGLAARQLELELTESMVMTDVDRATAMLKELKALGVRLAIDDFGTGYSSLAYLKRFPIDVLKIDKSFVRDIVEDRDSSAIALLVIALAHSLRLCVIAEGVETEDQLAFLVDSGCDQIQGYYFSRPVPVDQVVHQLMRRLATPPQEQGQAFHQFPA